MALVGGIPAKAKDLPSVFVWTTEDVELNESYCTGTKVAPTWMLTAAHCVLVQTPRPGQTELGPWKEIPVMNPGRKLKYSFSRSLRGPAAIEALTVRKLVLAPLVRSCLAYPGTSPNICERDVPLVDLALVEVEPRGAFLAAPVARLRAGPVAPGTAVLLTGYGAEDESQDAAAPRLTYQYATVSDWSVLQTALLTTQARKLGVPSPHFFFGVYSSLSQSRHTNLGGGDSGGPVYDARTGEVIGVNSDGFCPLGKPDCEIATNSFFARLDTFKIATRRETLLQ